MGGTAARVQRSRRHVRSVLLGQHAVAGGDRPAPVAGCDRAGADVVGSRRRTAAPRRCGAVRHRGGVGAGTGDRPPPAGRRSTGAVAAARAGAGRRDRRARRDGPVAAAGVDRGDPRLPRRAGPGRRARRVTPDRRGRMPRRRGARARAGARARDRRVARRVHPGRARQPCGDDGARPRQPDRDRTVVARELLGRDRGAVVRDPSAHGLWSPPARGSSRRRAERAI